MKKYSFILQNVSVSLWVKMWLIVKLIVNFQFDFRFERLLRNDSMMFFFSLNSRVRSTPDCSDTGLV